MVQRQGEPLNPHGLASLTAGEAVEGETGSIEHRGVPLPLPRQAQVLGGSGRAQDASVSSSAVLEVPVATLRGGDVLLETRTETPILPKWSFS